ACFGPCVLSRSPAMNSCGLRAYSIAPAGSANGLPPDGAGRRSTPYQEGGSPALASGPSQIAEREAAPADPAERLFRAFSGYSSVQIGSIRPGLGSQAMHTHSIEQWRHPHVFLGEKHERHERRTWLVVALTAAMMVIEIVG